jgi:hypothetical protein
MQRRARARALAARAAAAGHVTPSPASRSRWPGPALPGCIMAALGRGGPGAAAAAGGWAAGPGRRPGVAGPGAAAPGPSPPAPTGPHRVGIQLNHSTWQRQGSARDSALTLRNSMVAFHRQGSPPYFQVRGPGQTTKCFWLHKIALHSFI